MVYLPEVAAVVNTVSTPSRICIVAAPVAVSYVCNQPPTIRKEGTVLDCLRSYSWISPSTSRVLILPSWYSSMPPWWNRASGCRGSDPKK